MSGMLTDGIANPHWPNYKPFIKSGGARAYKYLTYGNLTPILAVTLHNGAPRP